MFEDGSVKIRGIAARRHDTPPLFARVQQEMLEVMARAHTVEQVSRLMPEVQVLFQRHAEMLRENRIVPGELAFTKQVSKGSGEYAKRNTVEKSAMDLLRSEGKSLKGGQVLRYVITDYSGKSRAVPVELMDEKTKYDSPRYVELLKGVCEELTLPFGCHIETV